MSSKKPLSPSALLHRRMILASAFGGVLALKLGGGDCAAAQAVGALSASDLPGGLTLISGAGANVVAAPGQGGAVMVDCGLAGRTDELLALVSRRTKAAKVATLFNTCWRLEQTGGNDILAAKGAKIVAHENTRLWMGAEIPSAWENKVYPPRPPSARPTETFYTTGGMARGADRIDYGYLLQAHTDGDMYVFFRKPNVLVVGAAVAARGWPVIDTATGGFIGGQIRGLESLIALADDKTVIVTADGPLLTKADLEKQRAMYVAILAKLQTCMESGFGLAQVLQSAPAADYAAERGDPTLFLTLAFRSLWGHVRQFKAI